LLAGAALSVPLGVMLLGIPALLVAGYSVFCLSREANQSKSRVVLLSLAVSGLGFFGGLLASIAFWLG